MDDLTPMDPEYREAAPETPPETPCYYGTGRQPEKRPSHLPVIIVLISLLAAANFITVFALLELKRSQTPSVSPTTGTELIALTPSENASAAPDPMQEAENGGHPSRYDMSGKRTVLISTCGFYTAKGNYNCVSDLFDRLCGKGGYTAIFCGQGELFRVNELA